MYGLPQPRHTRASDGGLCSSVRCSSPGRSVRPWPGVPGCWPRRRSERGRCCLSHAPPDSPFGNTARDARSFARSPSRHSIRRRNARTLLPSRALPRFSALIVAFRRRDLRKALRNSTPAADTDRARPASTARRSRAVRRPFDASETFSAQPSAPTSSVKDSTRSRWSRSFDSSPWTSSISRTCRRSARMSASASMRALRRFRTSVPRASSAFSSALPSLPSRATSIRSAISVLRFPASTPASRNSPCRRPTSLCNASASRAARRASRVSAITFLSFPRDASHRHFHDPASHRARTSAQRNSSARASATSARSRSRSYSHRQSRSSSAPKPGSGQSSSGPSATLTLARPFPSRIAMPSTILHSGPRYQPPYTIRPHDADDARHGSTEQLLADRLAVYQS